MQRYIARRLLLALPTLLIVAVVVFGMVRLLPGDVVELLLDEYQNPQVLAELRERLGLTQPVHIQFMGWMGDLVRGNLGHSLISGRSVVEEMRYRYPVTVELGLLSIVFTLLMGLPIGVISAVRQDSPLDYLLRSGSVVGMSVPEFWMATLVIVFGSLWFAWSPPLNYVSLTVDPLANLKMMWLPAFVIALSRAATVMRMTRSMMLEVMREDYIRTARAKGLRDVVVLSRHALKNALIPIVTLLGLQVRFILAGAVIIEIIFGLPGLGQLMLFSITKRDYIMLQGLMLVLAAGVLTINLIVDVLYVYLDPRIRYS